MKIILSIFLIVFTYMLRAQVQVVRDPIACAYGLKNNLNQWVVPAEYQQLLLLEPGIYACQVGEKWGILKSDGKIYLKPIYKQISVFNPGLFLVVEEKQNDQGVVRKTGILNASCQWVFEPEYESIQRMQDQSFVLVRLSTKLPNTKMYQTSIADVNGKLQFPFLDGIMVNSFYKKPVYLIGNSLIGSYTVSGNVRLIQANGEPVSSDSYDMGMPCGENFVVIRNRQYGLIDAQGKTLVEPQFTFDFQSHDYQNPIPCLHGTNQMQFIENTKRGILNGSWEVIVPANYDQINPIYSGHAKHTIASYIAQHSDTKQFHLLDATGKVIVESDTIVTRAIPIPKTSLYEQDQFKVFFCVGKRTDQHIAWGILDHNANEIVSKKYSTIIISDDFTALLIQSTSDLKNPKVSLVDLNSDGPTKEKQAKLMRKSDLMYLFEVEQKIYPLMYNPTNASWEFFSYQTNAGVNYGDLTLISSNKGALIVNRKTNEVQQVRSIDIHSGQFPSVQTEDGFNLIHQRKGFLFAKNKININQQFASINRIWAQNPNGKWGLYDTLGNWRIPIEFDAISYYWDTMIAQTNSKKGLLNMDGQWIFPPVFEDLFPVTKSIYVGITSTRKIAVLDSRTPSSRIDSSYTSFKPLVFKSQANIFYYALEKNGVTTCFDQHKKPLNLTEKQIWIDNWTAPRETDYALSLECSSTLLPFLNPLTTQIYNKIKPFHAADYLTSTHVVLNGIRGKGLHNWFTFSVVDASLSTASIKISKSDRQLREDYSKHPQIVSDMSVFETHNWILKQGEWQEIAFNELFNTSNASYRQQILEAIQNRPELKIDCNQPDYLFAGASHFSFDPTGIKLYFFVGSSQAFELLLSRAQLAKIGSAAWIVPLL